MSEIEKRLIEINDYYHDELVKALKIMRGLQEDELRYNTELTKRSLKDIENFLQEFKFQYHE